MKRFLAPLLCLGVVVALVGITTGPRLVAHFRPAPPAHVVPIAQPFASSTTVAIASSTKPVVKKPVKKPTTVATSSNPFVYTGVLPKEINLDVPFLSQAPKKNWAMPYQEACEEASMLMLDAYYRGQQSAFTPEDGDKAILSLVAWEEKQTPPYPVDLTLAQAGAVASGYFTNRRAVLQTLNSETDLKNALANGHPIIIPASGKTLQNPNFHNGGPVYHMLVIKGYTADGHWIANDPGTRLGADYFYEHDTILQAIHDWNDGDVLNGQKKILVVVPR